MQHGAERAADVRRRPRPRPVGVHHEVYGSGAQQVGTAADQLRAGIAAAYVQQNDGVLVHQQREKSSHLRGYVGVLLRKMDGDAARLQQRRRVPGAHQGLCLVQIEEMDGAALRRQHQRQLHGDLRLAAARLP